MKQFIVLSCILSLLLFTLPASTGAQEVIPLSSSVYSDMDLLYLLSGTGTPSGSRPWTKAEAQMILAQAYRQNQKEVEKALYASLEQRVYEELRWNFSDGFSLSAHADISVELYSHTNTDFSSYGSWVYSYVDRKPLVKLSLDLAILDFFYTYSDLQYGYGLHTNDDTLNMLGEKAVGSLIPANSGFYYIDETTELTQYQKKHANNIIPSTVHIEFQTPKRSIISLGSYRWNAVFSRDKITWGNSRIGNFVLNDHVDFHEYLRFVAFSDNFKYEALIVFFDTYYAKDPIIRMLLAHRLEFRIWEKFTFAVSENVMYQDSTLDLRFLNPAFVYHNLNERNKFNAIAHAELAYVPIPGLRFFGQFALDQAVAPNEDPDVEDTAWALSLGLEFATVYRQGIFSSFFEASMALPSMYRRDKVDFLMARRYASLNYWNAIKFDYIGSPYGGDAIVFLSESRYRVPERGELFLNITAVLKGEIDMYTPLNGGNTDYGTALLSQDAINTTLVATMGGSFTVLHKTPSKLKWDLYGSLSAVMKGEYLQSIKEFTSSDWDVQFVLGSTISL